MGEVSLTVLLNVKAVPYEHSGTGTLHTAHILLRLVGPGSNVLVAAETLVS